MRIAQISPLFESVPPKLYGGTERVVDNLTRGLIAAGAEVTVFCSGDSTTLGNKVAVWPEALRLAKKPIKDAVAYQARMLEMIASCAHEFDVIHNHYDYGLLSLSRRTRTPVVTTMHYRMDMPDLPAVLDHFPDAPLVSISDSQRGPMPNLNWIATVLHGIDTKALRFSAGPGKYLAFLGRFSPEKGAHWAIKLARKAGIPLKLAAKIPEDDSTYYERVIKPKLDGTQIEYVGEISESQKSEFLGGAIALLNPIDWPEPFGLVMAEAMACGTPVLGRPLGAAPEIVVDGVTGFLRANVIELGSLIERAARLDRARIRQYVESRFSIERMTREYLNVYRELITGQSSSRQARLHAYPGAAQIHHEQAQPGRMAEHRWDFLYPVDGAPERNLKGIA